MEFYIQSQVLSPRFSSFLKYLQTIKEDERQWTAAYKNEISDDSLRGKLNFR